MHVMFQAVSCFILSCNICLHCRSISEYVWLICFSGLAFCSQWVLHLFPYAVFNTQVPFDTDLVFFVCDNSTTVHICNDLLRFVPGSLQKTTRRLITANGTGPPVQEGTIKINLTDDDGIIDGNYRVITLFSPW